MGIFDFVKAAGRKLGILSEASASESPDQLKAAEDIKNYISSLNLGIENLKVHVDGDKAILEGKTSSLDALEKAILAAGNTTGISKVESKIETISVNTRTRFYTVKSGDSLSKIAKEYLGDSKRYPEIFEANKPLLKHPDEIYPGQNLRIPPEQSF